MVQAGEQQGHSQAVPWSLVGAKGMTPLNCLAVTQGCIKHCMSELPKWWWGPWGLGRKESVIASGSVFCTLGRSELPGTIKNGAGGSTDLVALPPHGSSLHGCWEAGAGLVITETSSSGDGFLFPPSTRYLQMVLGCSSERD